jgi:hypothetical protein
LLEGSVKISKPETGVNSLDRVESIKSYNWKLLEDLLEAPLPDWNDLKKKAIEIIEHQQPKGVARWLESSFSIKKKHLKKGYQHNLWSGESIVVLKAHPSFLEKVLNYLTSFLSFFLSPWYALKNALQNMIQNIAVKLGALFSLFALPVAFLAFLADFVTMIIEFITSLPRLLLSPLALARSFISMILEFFAKLVARIVWAFLLPLIGKIMSGLKPGKIETLQSLLKRKPWIKYIILGFFRSERPKDPVIISAKTVSQLLIARRGGLFHRGEYLVVVEGEKMMGGFMNRFWSWFKKLILPFYWERTIHILHLPQDPSAQKAIIDSVSSALDRQAENWF